MRFSVTNGVLASDSPSYFNFYDRVDFVRASEVFQDFEARGASYEQYLDAVRRAIAESLRAGEQVCLIEFHVETYLEQVRSGAQRSHSLEDRRLWAVDQPDQVHHHIRGEADLETILQTSELKFLALAVTASDNPVRSRTSFMGAVSQGQALVERFRQALYSRSTAILAIDYSSTAMGLTHSGTIFFEPGNGAESSLSTEGYQLLLGVMVIGVLGRSEFRIAHTGSAGLQEGFAWSVERGQLDEM